MIESQATIENYYHFCPHRSVIPILDIHNSRLDLVGLQDAVRNMDGLYQNYSLLYLGLGDGKIFLPIDGGQSSSCPPSSLCQRTDRTSTNDERISYTRISMVYSSKHLFSLIVGGV